MMKKKMKISKGTGLKSDSKTDFTSHTHTKITLKKQEGRHNSFSVPDSNYVPVCSNKH